MAILFSGKVRDFQALLAALAYAYPRNYKVANFVERPLVRHV